ncbi:hypothetical protein G7085_18345 [Tessaracoccus sp. HDW20]|uniref:hypothetical protein n=1 Tax=Tessaracoccus coleopterorum TaxID=2714950 RepID=UPI0018D38D82|nr:hypothetical protein [Tessaracoccus coleopterorum]NHB85861.1 hypothetical protein [Tessaracoccus coleopterorum]
MAGLASRRTYPLRSSFAPSYNMAVNLMATMGPVRSRELLEQSFAQYQSDKTVVQASRVERNLAADLARAREALDCHLGDAMAYARLRDRIGTLEAESSRARRAGKGEAIARSMTTLLAGDIVHIPRQGWSVVLNVGQKQRRDAEPWVQIISADHTVLKLQPHDLRGPLEPVGGCASHVTSRCATGAPGGPCSARCRTGSSRPTPTSRTPRSPPTTRWPPRSWHSAPS